MLLELALAAALAPDGLRDPQREHAPAPEAGTSAWSSTLSARERKVGEIVPFHRPRGRSPTSAARSPKRGAPCATPQGGPITSTTFVARIVAVGGDRISLRRGRVVRNGKLETRKHLRRCKLDQACDYPRTITVPAGHVYILGDNRGASDDSRFWGAVPVAQVLGRYVRTVR